MEANTFFEALALLKKTFDVVGGLKGAKAAQEHLDLLRTKLEFLGQEKAQAEEEGRRLEQRLAEVLAELETHRQFKVWRGANWRILPGGGFDLAIYCGACAKPAFVHGRTFACTCGWHSLFPSTEKSLIKVMVEAGEAYGQSIDEDLLAKRLHEEPEEPKAVRRVPIIRGPFGPGAF